MKKIIAILLAAVMVMSFAACGSINETNVAILWSGEGVVRVPNSLINAMERAMYIESISYDHYGANGDQAVQTQQAMDALNAGCAALAVELVDPAAAQEIVDAAKAKNVPVVFFNCDVEEAVVSSYEKCALVTTDEATLAEVQGKLIAEALYKEKKEVATLNEDRDLNGDGQISYAAFGDVAATLEVVNATLAEKGLPALVPVEGDMAAVIGAFTEEAAAVELIITADDATALEVLVSLQVVGYNKDRLKTHFVPVFTVGNDTDYKAYVMETMPAAPADFATTVESEIEALNDWWKADEAVEAWKGANAALCSLYSVDWATLDEFLYTTSDVIGSGRLSGTAMEDQDTISTTVAATLASLLKGEAIESNLLLIPYTTKAAK